MIYKCQRCLCRMGIKRMVDVRAALPQGSENFTLCTYCYEELTLKIRPETNSYAIMERLKKAFKRGNGKHKK